jgi:hypothetical protein
MMRMMMMTVMMTTSPFGQLGLWPPSSGVQGCETFILIIIIINMLMPVQQNSLIHLRVLLVLTDRGILAQSN